MFYFAFPLFRSVNDSIYAIMVYALNEKNAIITMMMMTMIMDSIVANAFMHTM